MTTTVASPAAAPDAVCAAAVDLAREAAVEASGPAAVGEHRGVTAEGERLVTHSFAAQLPGYSGWCWAVTVARAPRARQATVCEVVLLPGEEAVLAPAWLPWSERLRPGDLGVGDLLPTAPDDERLAPAYTEVDDPDATGVAFELGLGRARVLSVVGRVEAAERWHVGDHGPAAPIARAAPDACATCGFWLSLRGALGQLFGVCGNEFAPDDGSVVSADHGCGAHSETVVEVALPQPGPVIDDERYDVLPTLHEPGSVDDEAPSELLGHS